MGTPPVAARVQLKTCYGRHARHRPQHRGVDRAQMREKEERERAGTTARDRAAQCPQGESKNEGELEEEEKKSFFWSPEEKKDKAKRD